ncbi:hypothetical protein E4U23_005905 [Claviceps purpurea]|nr:hypothetical protein E4U23_005905 [Claviceps purpurea]
MQRAYGRSQDETITTTTPKTTTALQQQRGSSGGGSCSSATPNETITISSNGDDADELQQPKFEPRTVSSQLVCLSGTQGSYSLISSPV